MRQGRFISDRTIRREPPPPRYSRWGQSKGLQPGGALARGPGRAAPHQGPGRDIRPLDRPGPQPPGRRAGADRVRGHLAALAAGRDHHRPGVGCPHRRRADTRPGAQPGPPRRPHEITGRRAACAARKLSSRRRDEPALKPEPPSPAETTGSPAAPCTELDCALPGPGLRPAAPGETRLRLRTDARRGRTPPPTGTRSRTPSRAGASPPGQAAMPAGPRQPRSPFVNLRTGKHNNLSDQQHHKSRPSA